VLKRFCQDRSKGLQKGVLKMSLFGSYPGSPFEQPWPEPLRTRLGWTCESVRFAKSCSEPGREGLKIGSKYPYFDPFWLKKGSYLGPLFGPKSLHMTHRMAQKGVQKGVQNGSKYPYFEPFWAYSGSPPGQNLSGPVWAGRATA